MTAQEITELAAILVNEHGEDALRVARARRDEYAHEPRSDTYRLWGSICDTTAELLESHYAIAARSTARDG